MEFDCQSIPNHLLKNCRVFNQREDLIELLDSNLNIAEIGVMDGAFSQHLRKKAKFLCLIDDFNCNDWPSTKRFTKANHYEFVRNKFKDCLNVRVCQGDTLKILESFEDHHFDLVYLDGGAFPSYDVFKKRMIMAYYKIKVGGTLWVNDYTTFDPHTKSKYGVQKAVNEVINIFQLEVSYLSLNNSNFHDVCLRKCEFKISNLINEARLALYSNKYGNFFLFKNEEFISIPLKKGEPLEESLLSVILPYLQKQHTIIDVGAHVGSHTIPYAKRVSRVYAFEPQTLMYQILVKNCAMNKINNIKIGNYALGHLNNQIVSMNSQIQDGTSKNKNVSYDTDQLMNYGGLQLGTGDQKVTMKTLDGFDFKEKIRYMKVDAEGSEPLIFYGAQKLIRRDQPIILFEKRALTQVTQEMKVVMSIPPEIESFSIENFCVNELGYKQPILLDDWNVLLIPKDLSLPVGHNKTIPKI